MLLRSSRWFPLLVLLIINLLWVARNGIPIEFSPLDWTTYRLDVSNIYRCPNSASLETHPVPSNSSTTSYTSTSPTTRNLVSTQLPVISKPSPYGYVFYATADDYACAVLVNIQRLRQLFHTRHQIHVLAAPTVSDGYIKAFMSMNAIVKIEDPPPIYANSSAYYQGCLLKLVAFRMHEIVPSLKRVLVMDADQLILRSLDSMFELPEVDVAAPRAYWIGKDAIASTFLVITLSDRLWQMISKGMQTIQESEYDMDLVNKLLGDNVLMLPGSYVALNSHWEDWNMPSWYRPEGKEKTNNLMDGNKDADLVDLWEAINVLVSAKHQATPTRPSAKERRNFALQRRQLSHFTTSVPVTATNQVDNDFSELPEDRSWAASNLEIGKSRQESPATEISNESLTPTAVQSSEQSNETKNVDSEVNTATESPSLPSISNEGVISMNARVEDTKPTANADTNAPHNLNAFRSEPLQLAEQEQSQVEKEPRLPPPHPYDANTHPLRGDLEDLYRTAYVLHYTAIGKPWAFTMAQLKFMKPQAHPVLYDQFQTWRQVAKKICPKMRVIVPVSEEDDAEETEMWFDIVDVV
jgi:hypothetical protein